MQKKVTISILCLVCFSMLSCVIKPENKSTGLNTSGTVFSAISTRTILASLPQSVFDNTTEGISQQEMDILIQNLESDNWSVTDSRSGQLTIECKHSNSTLRVYAYALDTNAVLITHTVNERAISTETWVYNAGNQTVTRKELLPVVSINDFYAEGDMVADPMSYTANVVVSVRDDGTLVYDVYTWMDESLEMKQNAFTITAVWNGNGFNVERSAL